MAPRAGLVTGGSSGIGKALARVLGQEGYAVTIVGRDEGKLAAAAEELRGEGVVVEAVAADVAEEEAVARAVEAHVDFRSSRGSSGRPCAPSGGRGATRPRRPRRTAQLTYRSAIWRHFSTAERSNVWPCKMRGIQATALHRTTV